MLPEWLHQYYRFSVLETVLADFFNADWRARSRKSRSRFRTALHALLFAVLGAFATLVVAAILVIDNKPDLSVWHQAYLDEEFTEKSQVTELQDYHALEDKLFSQLQRDVYGKIAETEGTDFNRYNAGSRSDPGIWPRNWNRTFELTNDNAPYGVLLLHGYSDSPYSLRGLLGHCLPSLRHQGSLHHRRHPSAATVAMHMGTPYRNSSAGHRMRTFWVDFRIMVQHRSRF